MGNYQINNLEKKEIPSTSSTLSNYLYCFNNSKHINQKKTHIEVSNFNESSVKNSISNDIINDISNENDKKINSNSIKSIKNHVFHIKTKKTTKKIMENFEKTDRNTRKIILIQRFFRKTRRKTSQTGSSLVSYANNHYSKNDLSLFLNEEPKKAPFLYKPHSTNKKICLSSDYDNEYISLSQSNYPIEKEDSHEMYSSNTITNTNIKKSSKTSKTSMKKEENTEEHKENQSNLSQNLNQNCKFFKLKKDSKSILVSKRLLSNNNSFFGMKLYSNTSKIIGLFNLSNELQGIASYTNTKNTIYKGEFSKNILSGFGYTQSQSGSDYIGQWENNKRQGIGIEVWEEGGFYKGEFFNGKKEGVGSFYWKNGGNFIGMWENNMMNGLVSLYYI